MDCPAPARLVISTIALAMAFPSAAIASYTISCESQGYRYQYCSARTDGRVRLVNQTSSAPCVKGRSWGSDNGGVWVNNGCSAQFEVGGNSGGGGRDNTGAAVAAVAGLAILGAIIAKQDHDNNDHNGGYYPSPGYNSGPVPGWAVGTFNGSLYGRGQTIRINPDGAVNVWYRDGRSTQGWFSGGSMTIDNNRMNVQPSGGGIVVNGAYFGR